MIEPGKQLERTLKCLHEAFEGSGLFYWLSFGGLFGLSQNQGVVPDDDLDFCTFYGSDWKRFVQAMERYGYVMSKAMLDDSDPKNVVYLGFNHRDLIHICVSFWYLHDGMRYYCHDQASEVKGTQVPKSGYWFRGMPAEWVDNQDYYKLVEWPGIPQFTKVRVPLFPGMFFDYGYPGWAYHKQRYNVSKRYQVEPEKCVSIYRGHAVSPLQVYLKSMTQWRDPKYIAEQLRKGRREWLKKVKAVRMAI